MFGSSVVEMKCNTCPESYCECLRSAYFFIELFLRGRNLAEYEYSQPLNLSMISWAALSSLY